LVEEEDDEDMSYRSTEWCK